MYFFYRSPAGDTNTTPIEEYHKKYLHSQLALDTEKNGILGVTIVTQT